MILYSNRERWFLNIRSRNNRIIISDSLFFNFNRCSYFYVYGRMIFKPLLLREINMSSKRFTERSYYLRVKSIFSAKFTENIGVCRGIVTADVLELGLSRRAIATRKLERVNRDKEHEGLYWFGPLR